MNRFAFLFSVLLSTTCSLSAAYETLSLPSPAISTRPSYRLHHIRKLLEQKKWDAALQQLQGSLKNKEITLSNIEKLASRYPDSKLSEALVGAKGLLALGPSAALDPQTAFPIAYFAETALLKQVAKGVTYWPETLFGRELQYDTEKKRLFIHLGTQGVPPVGVGRSKVVTRTVLYDSKGTSVVMARAITTKPILREMKAMRDLSGLAGVIQAEGIMIHKDPKTHKKQYTVVTKLYNSGSLQNVFDKHLKKLSFKNRLTIAYNIMTGIASMHGKAYVHRDLGARNYFVNLVKNKHGKYSASCVVADMGRTVQIADIKGGPAQGNGTYMPPEGFFHSKMKGADYCASDLFAVGCVFWELYHGEKTPWGKKCFYKNESRDRKSNYKDHLSYLKKTRAHEKAKLKGDSSTLSTKDQFLSIILQMTDPDPARRGSAQELKEKLERLVKKNSAK